jgi:predicted enzyme related to lactoylglutathione lyase
MPSDAFESLRRPSSPSRPNPQFAVALRRRLLEELGMTTTEDLDPTTTSAVAQVGNVRIRTNDPDRAYAFFHQLFGWESDVFHGDGYIDHHIVNTSGLHHVLTNQPDAPPVRLFFKTDSPAAVAARVEELGGRIIDSGLSDDGGGWAFAEDDQGAPIGVYRPHNYGQSEGPIVATELLNEVGYLTVNVADVERGQAFYGDLLGWRFNPPAPNDYRHVVNTDLPLGVTPGDEGEPGKVVLYFRIENLEAAVARVQELGGAVHDVSTSASGGSALATTDEGTEFYLWEPGPGY